MTKILLELHRQECRIEGGDGPFWSAVLTDDGVLMVKRWLYKKSKFREFKMSWEMANDVNKVDPDFFNIAFDAYENPEPRFGYRPYLFLREDVRTELWEDEIAGYLQGYPTLSWWYDRVQKILTDMVAESQS